MRRIKHFAFMFLALGFGPLTLAQFGSSSLIAISIAPTAASVRPGNNLQFTATVSGTSNTSVTWMVNGISGGNSKVGTISTSGLYSAPSGRGNSPSSVTVAAVSNADSSQSAQAIVTITTGVAVAITPASVSLELGAAQQFVATVTGTSNTTVTWTVNGVAGGNSTVGTISSSGLYTAPVATPSGTIAVFAVSTANPTRSAQAAVTILSGIFVSISPTSASVQVGQTQQFSATVSGSSNTAVTWGVNGISGGNSALGTISSSGLYTAPATAPSATVVVSAASAADSTRSAQATITVLSTVSVSINPASATVQPGKSQQFNASITGTSNTAVNWMVNGLAGGNSTVGTVSSSGMYTAPKQSVGSKSLLPSAVTVTAVSFADPTKSADATVTIAQTVSVTVSPTSTSIQVGQTQQFTATVSGTTNTGVTWTVNGVSGGNSTVGTIDASGLYVAPSAVPSGTVTVAATSAADPTKSAQAVITVLSAVSVSITPTSASMQTGQSQQFTASVTGTSNTAVNWTVNGIAGGNSTAGLITASGLYTAPATVPTTSVTVAALSAADPTKSAQASVKVVALQVVSVSITPTSASVQVGQAQQFAASVSGTTNTSVVWTVNGTGGGDSTVGTISSSGLYTAPNTSPAAVTVAAVSAADSTKSAQATVTVTQPPLSITTTALPSGKIGVSYSSTLSATGGTVPYSWSIVSGQLPQGIGFGTNTGTISGTPSTAGSYNVTVQALDATGKAASASVNLTIVAAMIITTAVLPNGTVGVAYGDTLTVSGGIPPVVWAIASGQLPAGLSLSQSGTISGTPSTAGSYSFLIQATDSAGNNATQACSVAVLGLTGSPLTITNADLPNGTVGAPYAATMSATGGTPPYVWSIASGALPGGLTLSSATGAISGTPMAVGWSNFFRMQVQDSSGSSASLPYSVIINPVLDLYGGSTQLKCSQTTGWFHAEKINNRWWLCTPSGNSFFMTGVGAIQPAGSGSDAATGQSFDYNGIATHKYGDVNSNWGPQQNRRLLSWGFNSVGEASSGYTLPMATCTNCPGWPGSQQPVKLPMTQVLNVGVYAGVNLFGYANHPLKDMMYGMNSNYTAWRASILDYYDNAWGQYLYNFFANDSATKSFMRSPWTIGLFIDDGDWFWGIGAGPDFHTNPPGHNTSHAGYMALITSPVQTFNPIGTYGRQPQLYVDTKVYSKTAMAAPPSSCSLTTPCSLRDYLYKKYTGSISAVNAAWGSNYTTFDSTGTQMTGELIGTGDGATTTFMHMLASTPISPLSVLIKLNGNPISGDCPWFSSNCNIADLNKGTLGTPGVVWWQTSNYAAGWFVVDSNGNLERANTSGISGNTPPVWSTFLGGAVCDPGPQTSPCSTGSVTWVNQGPTILTGHQPWLSAPQSQSCDGCGLPHASYSVRLAYHMKPGYYTTPSFQAGITTDANYQVVVLDPCTNVAGCTSEGIFNMATGYDVYVSCMNQDGYAATFCSAPGVQAVGQETLQASNVPFGQNWIEPILGLTTGGLAVPQPPAVINYSTGQLSITFQTPPRSGAQITADYIVNGWMFGTGLMDEDGRHTAWVGTNSYCLAAATACDGHDLPLSNANANLATDLDGWLAQFAGQYFSSVRTAFKQNAPNLMYLGEDTIGTYGVPPRKEILQAASAYIDTMFATWYPDQPDVATAGAMYQYYTQYFGDKPIMNFLTMHSTPDSSLFRYNASGQVVGFSSEANRGEIFSSYLKTMLNTPSYNNTYQWVGAVWWGLVDFWNEKTNWGLVSLNDNPYDGKSACQALGSDQWGFATGGEEVIPSWRAINAYNTLPSTNGRIQVNIAGTLYLFGAVRSGISGVSAPVWPTQPRATVADGTVTWQNVGIKAADTCYGDTIDYVKQANSSWWYGLLTGSLP